MTPLFAATIPISTPTVCQQIGPVGPPAYDTVIRVVESAKFMATMEPVAIWACMFLISVGYIVYMTRQHRQYDKKVEEMRKADADAEIESGKAMVRLATEIAQLKVILDERIPRRNDHV